MTPAALYLLSGWGALRLRSGRGSVDLGTYVREIHAVREGLDRLTISRVPSGGATQLAAELARLAQVRLPDGRVLDTNTPELASRLMQSPASVPEVARSLDLLDDRLQGLAPGSGVQVQLGTLDDILRDPRFHQQPSLLEQLWNAVHDAAARYIDDILNAAFGGIGAGRLLIAALFLLLLTCAAVLAARGTFGRTFRDPAMSMVPVPVFDAEAAMQQARDREADGDFRAALHFLFLGTLLTLAEFEWIQLRPGQTNQEYVRSIEQEVGSGFPSLAALRELVLSFDRIWYGQTDCSRADYRRCLELSQHICQGAGRRTAA